MAKMRKCKNKKCSKLLPEGYKYKYCESCRGKKAETVKGLGVALGLLVGTVITIVTKGKINKKI